jgi:hypothetical protein
MLSHGLLRLPLRLPRPFNISSFLWILRERGGLAGALSCFPIDLLPYGLFVNLTITVSVVMCCRASSQEKRGDGWDSLPCWAAGPRGMFAGVISWDDHVTASRN